MEDLDDIWESLEKDKITPSEKKSIILRRLRPIGLHIGLDLSSGKKILLLEIKSSKEININDFPKWKGVDLSFLEFSDKKDAVLLKLVDHQGLTILNAIINDIYESLENITDLNEASELFIECLNHWSDFFNKYGYNGLGKEAQRGLFGELYFLKEYVLKKANVAEGINYWRGHSRKFQDFSFPNGNVEIKTTIKKEHKTVIVSSEKQLDDAGLKSLFLCCLSLNVSENKGHSLPEIVQQIRESISPIPNALRLFNRFLQNAGYLNQHEMNYKDDRFIIHKNYFFKVGPGFPRIITLPTGVGDIKYSIVLSACKEFEIDIKSSIEYLLGGA
jgi:hypothetical protein